MSAQTTGEPEVMRYGFEHPSCKGYCCCGGGSIEPDDAGDYVRYADYLTAIAQRDAAVHQIKIAKVCNDSQAELIERLTLEKRQTFDEINDLRAKLDAAVRERAECVAREQRWLARLAACCRVVEAVDDDYGPNDGYARTVNRTPPQDPTPPQEATNDDA